MKLIKYIQLFCLIFMGGAPLIIPTITYAAEEQFSMSEGDLDLLESMGFSREQAQEMADLVNNLTPEEQQALAQIGQEIETDMKKAGVDPNDPEQMFSYFNKMADDAAQEGNVTPEPSSKPVMPEITERPTITPSMPYKPSTPAVPSEPHTSKMLIDGLLYHIASLRQKAANSSLLSHRLEGRFKQELDELTYYLHIISKDELQKYLTAKEAPAIYKALNKLHEVLSTYEPLVNTVSLDEGIENPYELLGIQQTDSQDIITAAYEVLKDAYDPEILKSRIDPELLDTRDVQRQLKEANLHFQAIADAYDSISNPAEKAQIDKTLANRLRQRRENERSTERAFNQCNTAITQVLYEQNIIKEIQTVLTKYAPEEKKKADEWEKARQAALAQQKKLDEAASARSKSAQSQGLQGLKNAGKADETGKRFWQGYNPEKDLGRGSKGGGPRFDGGKKPSSDKSNSSGSKGGGSSKGGGGSKGGSGGGSGSKSDKKDDAKGKDAGKSDKKDDKGKSITTSEKDIVKAAELTTKLHSKEFDDLSKELKSKSLHPHEYQKSSNPLQHLFFSELMGDLASPYSQGITPDALVKIDADVMQKYGIEKIAQDLSALAGEVKKAKKEDLEAFAPVWQSFAKNHKKTVSGLSDLIQNSIGKPGAQNTNIRAITRSGRSTIHRSQLAFHKLIDSAAPAQKDKIRSINDTKKDKKSGLKPTDPGYLSYVRDQILTIEEQFNNINKKLGATDEPKKGTSDPEKKETEKKTESSVEETRTQGEESEQSE